MTLVEYFRNQPRGSKAALAEKLGISRTWMSQILSGRRLPSPSLANQIEQLTGVKRETLRPDLFGGIRES